MSKDDVSGKLTSLFCDSPRCRPIDTDAVAGMKKLVNVIRVLHEDPSRRPTKNNAAVAGVLNSKLENANKAAIARYNMKLKRNKTMESSKAVADALKEIVASGVEASRPGLGFLSLSRYLCYVDCRIH